MSHEFRTPINLMMGYVQLVQEGMLGDLKAEQGEALRQSLRYSKNLLNLLTDLLYASRLQARIANILITRVNLGRILDVLRSDIEVWLKENLTLDWQVPLDLPLVETDGDKVKQIVHCLVNNAIKFTEAGSVRVALRVVPESSILEIEVADTGSGIPEDQISRIFDLFHQVDSSTSRGFEGAGLGLYIVKNNAELLGGEVKVASELGRGSTFAVTLPIRIVSGTTP
jgi:signal transduction histidine kinase